MKIEISFRSKLNAFHKNDYALGFALIKRFYGNSELGYYELGREVDEGTTVNRRSEIATH